MTGTMPALVDEPHVDGFIVDDWETTELSVPVTDQATATAEPPATATPPETSPHNRNPSIEAFLYINEYPEYQYDGIEASTSAPAATPRNCNASLPSIQPSVANEPSSA